MFSGYSPVAFIQNPSQPAQTPTGASAAGAGSGPGHNGASGVEEGFHQRKQICGHNRRSLGALRILISTRM